MAGEWRRNEISRLMEDGKLVIGDGYRAKNDELASRGLPFARAGNINDGFRFDDADYFPEENLARVGNKVSQAGDVVFTSKGKGHAIARSDYDPVVSDVLTQDLKAGDTTHRLKALCGEGGLTNDEFKRALSPFLRGTAAFTDLESAIFPNPPAAAEPAAERN